jgi:hypothetical protein
MGVAQASDYLENILIDHLFRTRTFAKPAGLYLALFTANWNATQGGTSGNSSGTAGATANAVAITFPAPTGNWGTVTHFGIFDAASGGNLLIWDALVAARTILSGDPAASFAPGALQVTVA